jgi:hypothetical protein
VSSKKITNAPEEPPPAAPQAPADPDDDKHRIMSVLPVETYKKMQEMAAAHNSNPSSIVHMAILCFYESDPFMAMQRKARAAAEAADK